MGQHLNIIYGSINPYSTEHGRAMQIYPRLAQKECINIVWINPPLIPWNITKFISQYVAKDIVYGNIEAITPPGFPYYLSNRFSWLFTNLTLNIFISTMDVECDLFIVSSPIFLEFAKSMKKKAVPIIYDCRDVFSKWEHVGECAIQAEKELISISNTVITSSEGIKNEVLKINADANVISIPNGVPQSMIGVYSKRTKSSKPRIGFVGHMGYYVDLDLVIEIAKEKASMDFILVGNCNHIKEIVEKTPPNCIFMGEVSFENLNDLYSTFDVGIIPFKVNELVDPIIPIKLIEYFAKGLPVVCSPLSEVKRIDINDLIHYANGKEDWINKIEIALSDNRNEKFIEFAKSYTWENAVERYMSIMEELVSLTK